MEARRLELSALTETAERLVSRIDDRFADRGISRLARELVAVASETKDRLARLGEPRWDVRVAIAGLVVLTVAVVGLWVSRIRLGFSVEGVDEWLGVLQDGIQDAVFIGIAAVFLVSVEGRLKRRQALAGLHELRSIAHVIDMHQLTKDPDTTLRPAVVAAHSPARSLTPFELGRYLDYCSEMLSITSKLAALYAQQSRDPVVLSTVREIEDLTGALSAKIWQKVMILDSPRELRERGAP